MASFPATDLNTRRWAWEKAEQFCGLVVANTALVAIAAALSAGLIIVGYCVHQVKQQLADFKPIVIRINDVGKAEVVYYRDFAYRPEALEVKRSLTEFVTNFYTHMRSRIEDRAHSLYYLSQPLSSEIIQKDQKTKFIEDLERGKLEENSVRVQRVSILNLSTPPYLATVDFERIYLNPGGTEKRRESAIATIKFVFAEKVWGRRLQYDPLGLTITDFHDDQGY